MFIPNYQSRKYTGLTFTFSHYLFIPISIIYKYFHPFPTLNISRAFSITKNTENIKKKAQKKKMPENNVRILIGTKMAFIKRRNWSLLLLLGKWNVDQFFHRAKMASALFFPNTLKSIDICRVLLPFLLNGTRNGVWFILFTLFFVCCHGCFLRLHFGALAFGTKPHFWRCHFGTERNIRMKEELA